MTFLEFEERIKKIFGKTYEGELERAIRTLRKEDQKHIRDFIEISLEYFSQHTKFLKGAGFYLIGSALLGKHIGDQYLDEMLHGGTENWQRTEKEEALRGNFRNELCKKYGDEKMKKFRFQDPSLPSEEYSAIKEEEERGFEEIKKQVWRGYIYKDIDFVIAGLPANKINPKQEFWTGYVALLQVVDALEDAKQTSLFCFRMRLPTDAYDCAKRRFTVHQHHITFPNNNRPSEENNSIDNKNSSEPNDPKNPGKETKIHFMVYKHQCGLLKIGVVSNAEQWKALQEQGNLPYVPIQEF